MEQQEAQRLLEDILGVVRSAGIEAGAVRGLQALRATLLTAVEAARDGELQEALQTIQRLGTERVDDAPLARLLRRLFQKLGSTYVKLGQFIASSPTLFPAAYVREFQQCLDRTEPTNFQRIKRIVEADLGRPLSEVYESFEEEPLASASVAQVHSAVLKTGERVAVKVQKPGVDRVLKADLGFLFIAARTLEFLSPELAGVLWLISFRRFVLRCLMSLTSQRSWITSRPSDAFCARMDLSALQLPRGHFQKHLQKRS